MGILAAAKPAVVVCTRNRDRATVFYRDIPGLTLASQDTFAAITLRLSAVPDFSAHEHTIIGFQVPDVTATVRALRERA